MSKRVNVPEIFGSLVFNDEVMHERLPRTVYDELNRLIEENKPLTLEVAQDVASCMKSWAVEHGATHFTHWFQPMTGITAEKHDSFIKPVGEGRIIMNFSGNELIRSEPDASSFPSGGLRATFEARGYTAWDPTSYAFIKDKTLCIPSIFCSYGGQVLDKKTPLLRSIQALNKQSMKMINLLGNPTGATSVSVNVGGEQEYFLIDRDLYNERDDLKLTGRTLFGAKPPKGQEMEDHYFGTIKPRVKSFMDDLNIELWKLGIYANTEHNEVAPSQHELAPIFSDCNTATDQNQLTMEIMKTVAIKHNLACLIHEKPFAGVNGSGKHNNWSITTNTGVNVFDPGKAPAENTLFLVFLAAVVKGTDEYQDLIRACVSNSANDLRLGGNEAPPAIVSLYLGDELGSVVDAIEHDEVAPAHEAIVMKSGVKVIPRFDKDTSDRNRTSPFAFTGNKFELRMVGSSASLSTPNVVLNTIVAEELSQFYERLENATDIELAANELVSDVFKEHGRIIFNGNNYSEKWVEEAKRRGLLNLKTTADAMPAYLADKNVALFEKHKIYTREELESRYEIGLETYCKSLHIEALTMLEMARRDIAPAVCSYMGLVADTVNSKREAIKSIPCKLELDLLADLSKDSDNLAEAITRLEKDVRKAEEIPTINDRADYYRDFILKDMEELRTYADNLETVTAKEYWPFPTYTDLLYSVV
ncbi:MAG: glutamine synthetase III [Clostridia bacterium]|nr:glutamine synthetase III [Clostridia bacterium]MBR6479371.1 glutamine synthetase III [Clostridia bacterium]